MRRYRGWNEAMLLYQTYCLISSSEVQSNGVSPVRLAPAEMRNSTVGKLLTVAVSWRGVERVSEL